MGMEVENSVVSKRNHVVGFGKKNFVDRSSDLYFLRMTTCKAFALIFFNANRPSCLV